MKKTLIIALCCLAVVFTACNKEKPYEKFIGDYEGSGLVNGKMIIAGGLYSQDFNDIAIPMKINLSAGDADNKVVLTYINDELDETYTATGTITDNSVDFDPVTVNTTIESYVVNATLDMDGTLAGNILTLNGVVTGGGTFIDGGMSLNYTIEGTMTGNLNKMVVTPEQ